MFLIMFPGQITGVASVFVTAISASASFSKSTTCKNGTYSFELIYFNGMTS